MITLILAVIFGWIGSLIVNYLSDVLPITRKLSRPDCIDCQVDLELNFYLFNQPCKNCGSNPSVRHWIVFVLGPLLAGLIYFLPPPNLGLWGGILWLILFGLIGCAVVMHTLGFNFHIYMVHLQRAVTLKSFVSGMIKVFAFGIAIASIGCLHGLKTRLGASSVGYSTTRAVVSSIVMVVFIDGVFATIYYVLGI